MIHNFVYNYVCTVGICGAYMVVMQHQSLEESSNRRRVAFQAPSLSYTSLLCYHDVPCIHHHTSSYIIIHHHTSLYIIIHHHTSISIRIANALVFPIARVSQSGLWFLDVLFIVETFLASTSRVFSGL